MSTQKSGVENLKEQGYTVEILKDLQRRHEKRVHTPKYPLGRPCIVCDGYAIDITALKMDEALKNIF